MSQIQAARMQNELFVPNYSSALYGCLPSHGRFRANSEDCQINATNDLDAVAVWLKEKARNSTATFESYRKEAERLLMWAANRGVALSGMTRADMADYDSFLRDPQPTDLWVLPIGENDKRARVPRSHPNWRPFAGPLSESSREAAFNALRALFSYLHATGYLRINALAKNKLGKENRTTKAQKLRHRYLPETVWCHLKEFVFQLPRDTPRQIRHAIRSQWILTLLYETGARRNEIAKATISDFRRDDKNHYWLRLQGKGNKDRDVPVSDELISLCRCYRTSMGLSLSLSPDDPAELVLSLTGKKGVSEEMIWRVVRQLCTIAAEQVESDRPEDAALLRIASTHWIRHTKATHLIRQAGIKTVQEFLGHESLETTGHYQHIDREQMHREIVGEGAHKNRDD